MAGSDLKAGYLRASGIVRGGRHRLRSFSVTGTASAGYLEIFDSMVAPTAGTYGRSGATVTVTSNGHGLRTGDVIGISYDADGSARAATPNNYAVTVTDANTFTITDINSGTVTAGTNCRFVTDGGWIFRKDISANDTFANIFTIPDEGMLIKKGIFLQLNNLSSASVVYS